LATHRGASGAQSADAPNFRLVQPSSLIFLVLVAIWVAYLLQHWVRRREHLATARSVDRFSDAMRVLERRARLPELDLSAPRPRSYAVSPARPSRPEVVVKRAQSPRPDVPMEPSPVVRPTRLFHFLAGMSARRLRGLSLLAALSLTVLVTLLAAFSVLSGWSVLAVLAVLAADLAWLRHVAVLERAIGEVRDQEDEDQEDSGPARSAAGSSTYFEPEIEEAVSDSASRYESEPVSDSAPVFDSEAEPPRRVGTALDPTLVMKLPGVVRQPSRQTEPSWHSEAPEPGEPAEATEVIESPAQPGLSGWAPVPVPPPTYTLKAKAPEPVSAEISDPAAGVSWSLEGLVYDCELDELVERRSATGA